MSTIEITVNGYTLPWTPRTSMDVAVHAQTIEQAREGLAVLARIPSVGKPTVRKSGWTVWVAVQADRDRTFEFVVFFPDGTLKKDAEAMLKEALS